MLADRYDLPVSTTSTAVRNAYVEGCELALTMYPGAVECFDRALTTDPGLALTQAGCLLARVRPLGINGAGNEAPAPVISTAGGQREHRRGSRNDRFANAMRHGLPFLVRVDGGKCRKSV